MRKWEIILEYSWRPPAKFRLKSEDVPTPNYIMSIVKSNAWDEPQETLTTELLKFESWG